MRIFRGKEGPPLTPPEGYGQRRYPGVVGNESNSIPEKDLEARLREKNRDGKKRSLPKIIDIEGMDEHQLEQVLRELTPPRR